MQTSQELEQSIQIQLSVAKDLDVLLNATKRLTKVRLQGVDISLPFEASEPEIRETDKGRITIEDLSHHPMSFGKRWDAAVKASELPLQDHQQRFIVTLEGKDGTTEAYILPKIFAEGEPLARIALDPDKSPSPFSIEMAEVQDGNVIAIDPKKPHKHARILHATQILGHVQDAANIQSSMYKHGNLLEKWQFALPPDHRTERTLKGVRVRSNGTVPTDQVTAQWTYPGGTNFRTGKDYRTDYSKPESFDAVAGFVAANTQMALAIAKGEFAVVSTNYRAEPEILKVINPDILVAGLTFTFLTGKPRERVKLHADLPRFAHMLQRVQDSLDAAPARYAQLGEPEQYVDDWWRISEQKTRGVNVLLYRSLEYDSTVPSVLPNGTEVIQVPPILPEIYKTKEEARVKIGEIIGQPLQSDDRVIILAGESDDGSFSKRADAAFTYARNHPNVHVIMPIKPTDPRLAEFSLPENAHAIGFRHDWWDIIPGGDLAFLRGSWGELLDIVATGTVPIIASPGTVPMDAELEKTQFLTEVSGERANNISLLIKALQNRGVSANVINNLLIDLNNSQDANTLDCAIDFALRPEISQIIHSALSNIPRNGSYWIGKIHEQLLDKRRPFSQKEINQIERKIWFSDGSLTRRIASRN